MNVIGTRADRWWNDPDGAMRGLVEEFAAYARATGVELTVVFDRRLPGMDEGDHEGVEVRFATRRGRNAADHEIEVMVAEEADPSSIRVVTSDRRLSERVREMGARVVSSGTFVRDLDATVGRSP
ncbi:MAG: NYN domain-containing protein [Actinobacteria bacterium]|nr:NYN domain-containing protein [Actinomycetota bacterium]